MEVKKWCGVQVVGHSKTWCSDGYGSVGEHEMRSDRGLRKGEKTTFPFKRSQA